MLEMQIGLLTNCLVKEGMNDLERIGEWALSQGFEALEVGPTIPLNEQSYASVLKKGRIKISAMTYCRNYLSSDEEEAKHHLEELKRRIRFAGEYGIGLIVTSTGIDQRVEEGAYDRADAIRRIPERSLDRVEAIFQDVLALAESRNVKIGFENCPLMGNIAISPVMWRKLFKRLESPNLGLVYDPSHLVWQFINPYDPIDEFAGKILHVHAKDTEINRELLGQSGFLTDFKWWNYRIPGNGELDWKKLFDKLRENGFQGTVSIEHEDHDYEGSLQNVQLGLIKGRENLMKRIGGNV